MANKSRLLIIRVVRIMVEVASTDPQIVPRDNAAPIPPPPRGATPSRSAFGSAFAPTAAAPSTALLSPPHSSNSNSSSITTTSGTGGGGSNMADGRSRGGVLCPPLSPRTPPPDMDEEGEGDDDEESGLMADDNYRLLEEDLGRLLSSLRLKVTSMNGKRTWKP